MPDDITVAAMAEKIAALEASRQQLEARIAALEWKVTVDLQVAEILLNSRRKGTP